MKNDTFVSDPDRTRKDKYEGPALQNITEDKYEGRALQNITEDKYEGRAL